MPRDDALDPAAAAGAVGGSQDCAESDRGLCWVQPLLMHAAVQLLAQLVLVHWLVAHPAVCHLWQFKDEVVKHEVKVATHEVLLQREHRAAAAADMIAFCRD